MSNTNLWDFSNIRDYTWADAGYLNYDFEETLDVIRKAAEHHVILLNEKRLQLEADIANDEYLQSDEPDEYKAQYENQRYDHIKEFNNKLEYSLNSASVMSAIASLEAQMYIACRYLKEELKIAKEIKKMKPTTGDGELDKIREFLITEVGIKPTGSDQHFSAIRAYKELRNIFVHSPSTYEVTPELTSALKNLPHVCIVKEFGEDRLQFSWPEFLSAMLTTFGNYFTKIVYEIDDVFIARNQQQSSSTSSSLTP